MKNFIFFSHNKNKIDEVVNLFEKSKLSILNLNSFAKINEPEEIGKTFEENAEIKSSFGFKVLKIPCFAEDSGICINSMNNLPGIKSKRFIEQSGSAKKAFEIILKAVKKYSDTKAYFKTSVCLSLDKNKSVFF